MAWNPKKTIGQVVKSGKEQIGHIKEGNLGAAVENQGRTLQKQTSYTPVLKQAGNYFGGAASTSGQFLQSPGKIGSIAKNLYKGISGGAGGGQPKFDAAPINEAAFAGSAGMPGGGPVNAFSTQLATSNARLAPTLADPSMMSAATIDQAKQEEFRQQQMALAQALQAQSMGQGPSLANMQLKQGTDRNLAQAMAMAGSMRGGNAAAGLRNLQNQTSMVNQQAAQQASMNRMQEQMSAREQLAGVLSSGRGQDIGLATSQAGLSQQASLANQQATNDFSIQRQRAALEQGSQNDAMARFYGDSSLRQSLADQLAAQELERLKVQRELGVGQINAGIGANNQQFNSQLISGLGSAASMAYMMSDENVKTDIKSGDDKIREFLNTISAHDYKYKDSKHGKGRFVTPMAQELEKSEAGKAAVIETADGKAVHYGRIAGTMLAAQGHLNKRLGDLEKALKMKMGA